MRTDDLVQWLAADARPVAGGGESRRFAVALGLGFFASLLLMLVLMGLRTDIGHAVTLPMFWLKLAFPASLALAASVAVHRLGHPGMRLGRVSLGVTAPLLILWLLAALVLLEAAPDSRLGLIAGTTWRQCALNIAVLSVPALAAALWAVKRFAPTRLRLAGAAAGLFAGAAAASAYALHCTEMEAPFLAVWYVAGVLIPTAAGAMLGPRLLHW